MKAAEHISYSCNSSNGLNNFILLYLLYRHILHFFYLRDGIYLINLINQFSCCLYMVLIIIMEWNGKFAFVIYYFLNRLNKIKQERIKRGWDLMKLLLHFFFKRKKSLKKNDDDDFKLQSINNSLINWVV